MSNTVKILIASLIIIIISVLFYLFIFSNIFYVRQIDFININLENRYKKELQSISVKIEELITAIDKEEVSVFIGSVNSDKFTDKQASKTANLADELSKAKKLIIESQNGLEKIKIFDNNGKIIFSTDDTETVKKGNDYISFTSKDNIQRRDDFFDFNKNKINNFIFDSENGYVILKRNIPDSGPPAGIMLFYYRDTLLNDMLRKSPYIEFNKPVFLSNNIIVIEKPKNLNKPINNIDISKNTEGIAVYTDSEGNEIAKSYRIFFQELKNSNLYICRFIDNDIFKVKKRDQVIIFYFLLFTLYLLIMLLFLLRKSTFEKAREKMSLFIAAILEEMIEAKTKGDVEKIHKQLEIKKESVLKNVFFDFKRLNEKDKKQLESELDSIFGKIGDGLKQREIIGAEPSNINKIEQIFEKFITTIAEKGININAPVKAAQKTEEIKSQNAKQLTDDNLEEIEEIEEIEEADEINEAENAEEIQDAEEISEVADAESVEEAETLEEAETVEEIQEADDAETAEEIVEIDDAVSIKKTEEAPSETDENLVELSDELSISGSETGEDESGIIYDDKQSKDDLSPAEKKSEKKEFSINEIFDRNTDGMIDEMLDGEIIKAEIPDDITIDSFFDIGGKKPDNIQKKDIAEQIEELDSEEPDDIDEIPKIPEQFYKDYQKDDTLADTIRELSVQKTPIQIILEDINNKLKPYKITLLMNMQKKYNFMQIHQLGFEHARIEKIILDENNLLTKHLFTNKRMIYVADINKVKDSFNNEAFEKELSNMKSLLLYPIKIFGKIRSLLVLIFNNDETDNLEHIIETIENRQNDLRKHVIKLI